MSLPEKGGGPTCIVVSLGLWRWPSAEWREAECAAPSNEVGGDSTLGPPALGTAELVPPQRSSTEATP